jgi:hypothetical protein
MIRHERVVQGIVEFLRLALSVPVGGGILGLRGLGGLGLHGQVLQ